MLSPCFNFSPDIIVLFYAKGLSFLEFWEEKGSQMKTNFNLCLVLFFQIFIAAQEVQKAEPGSSQFLTSRAWEALSKQDWTGLEKATAKCISDFSAKALEQQQTIKDFPKGENTFSFWALNDVATCYYIRARSFKEQGNEKEAIQICQEIAAKFPLSQCYDPFQKLFWKVAEGARDLIVEMKQNVSFGDYKSATLTTRGWESLLARDWEKLKIYTEKCIYLYLQEARKQETSLSDYPLKEKIFGYWALNDVATCYFIKAKGFVGQGETAKAVELCEQVVRYFSFSQCYDPGQKLFWKVAEASKDLKTEIESGIDYGVYSSWILTERAWKSLKKSEWEKVKLYTDKCIHMYLIEAEKQQESLNAYPVMKDANRYWALNDVSTCFYIQAKALKSQDETDGANELCQEILDSLYYGQCLGGNGKNRFFWRVADAAKNLMTEIKLEVDFGDCKSETLVRKAWEALEDKEPEKVKNYGEKCNALYAKIAQKQGATLSTFPGAAYAFSYWALNDVGTIHFVMAKAFKASGNLEKARTFCQAVIKSYPYSQCYDPKDKLFWKVAEASKNLLLEMDKKVDFGDLKSETLTKKAWEELQGKKYSEAILYARKCASLYYQKARVQSSLLSYFASLDKAGSYWALNDVGTCYFILGEAYDSMGEWENALNAYKTLTSAFYYCQCWDPKGWYWKPAMTAKEKVKKIRWAHRNGNKG